MSAKIVLSKSVTRGEEPSAPYKLHIEVASAENITPNIFVVRYTPGSKYTGPEEHTFWNVAYFDELTSIQDTPSNRKKSCYIRRSCLDYSCVTEEDLQDFITTVVSDVQRLLKSVNDPGDIVSCSTFTITDETAVEQPCVGNSVPTPDTTENSSGTTITLSFTGD